MLKELDYHKKFAQSVLKEEGIDVKELQNQQEAMIITADKPKKKWFGIF